MTLAALWMCEGPDCDSHQRSELGDTPPYRSGWVSVSDGSGPHHFCSWDCLLRYGAKREPLEEVPL
jgi:hypothetical protein